MSARGISERNKVMWTNPVYRRRMLKVLRKARAVLTQKQKERQERIKSWTQS